MAIPFTKIPGYKNVKYLDRLNGRAQFFMNKTHQKFFLMSPKMVLDYNELEEDHENPQLFIE